MQQLYRTQIEHLQIKQTPKLERNSVVDEKNYISIRELAKVLNLDKADRKKFKKAASKLQESGDFRFTVIEDELYALKNADYSDFMETLK
jgi:predicted transcriptional regulator of viral defense system